MSQNAKMYLQQLQSCITAIAQQAALASALKLAYFERGYGVGAANELTNDDLADAGLSVAQATACITLFEQFEALATAQRAMLAIARRDL